MSDYKIHIPVVVAAVPEDWPSVAAVMAASHPLGSEFRSEAEVCTTVPLVVDTPVVAPARRPWVPVVKFVVADPAAGALYTVDPGTPATAPVVPDDDVVVVVLVVSSRDSTENATGRATGFVKAAVPEETATAATSCPPVLSRAAISSMAPDVVAVVIVAVLGSETTFDTGCSAGATAPTDHCGPVLM